MKEANKKSNKKSTYQVLPVSVALGVSCILGLHEWGEDQKEIYSCATHEKSLAMWIVILVTF